MAILFEKKEIKQKYSFEVLCDFIYDKAKRLFTKYDNLQRDTKQREEEHSFFNQRKIEGLETEC